jgi:hypothetical protein|tara:strand:+ start:26 stop:322 length:297 start_codon:yes stop_codon:yes gene_type:complete
MSHIFQTTDKSGRKIHLSKERWNHINQEHPEVSEYLEEIKETLKSPTKLKEVDYDEDIRYFYDYYKSRKAEAKYLLVIVKYLNGEGFIITAYFVRNIK